MHISVRIPSIVAAIGLASTLPCRAQCLDWDDRFYATDLNGAVSAMVVFDDGSGPALYVGGSFTIAGRVSAAHIARWNGSRWSTLGSGVDDDVHALAVFDDGSGAALYVGGDFVTAGGITAMRVARWNGSNWASIGEIGDTVRSLAAFDDGNGAALYAGGDFVDASAQPARYIAQWNGIASWSQVGGGMNQPVFTLAAHDDGSGAALYAGGHFSVAGGISQSQGGVLAPFIARWNGTAWSRVGGSLNGDTNSLAVYDDGAGPALYAGGIFNLAGGVSANRIAKWNGSSWSALGSGMSGGAVRTLAVVEDAGGTALYAGGAFSTAGGLIVNRIARWNGMHFSSIGGAGLNFVDAIAAFDFGAGPTVFVGGDFKLAGNVNCNQIAQWNAISWSVLEPGLGLEGRGTALQVFDDGTGPSLFVGGDFADAGDIPSHGIARWNGTSWNAVGDLSFYIVVDFAVFDDGSGPALYAGTLAPSIVWKWDGASWNFIGECFHGYLLSLEVHTDANGPALYAGGRYTTMITQGAATSTSSNNIARWNGTKWSAVGSGIGSTTENVETLHSFDDGGGLALYAGGTFTTAGGVSAQRVAKWNGSAWSALGAGIDDGSVLALAGYDGGAGPALYAAGSFTTTGGSSAQRIAKWNGSAWSNVGSGLNEVAYALEVFDDGSDSALYVGGAFTVAGGVSASQIARWDGSAWSTLGTGISQTPLGYHVEALAAYDDGTEGAPHLYMVGGFQEVGGRPASAITKWRGCGPGEAYCFGDGLDPGVTAQCPCSNSGAPGRGCANSAFASGGRLFASGKTHPNTIVFTLTDVPNKTLATGIRNSTSGTPGGFVFGDGVRCQSGNPVLFGSHNTGSLGDAPHTWSSTTDTIAPGFTRYYQILYRNPSPAFCAPETFNVSNAYRLDW